MSDADRERKNIYEELLLRKKKIVKSFNDHVKELEVASFNK